MINTVARKIYKDLGGDKFAAEIGITKCVAGPDRLMVLIENPKTVIGRFQIIKTKQGYEADCFTTDMFDLPPMQAKTIKDMRKSLRTVIKNWTPIPKTKEGQ